MDVLLFHGLQQISTRVEQKQSSLGATHDEDTVSLETWGSLREDELRQVSWLVFLFFLMGTWRQSVISWHFGPELPQLKNWNKLRQMTESDWTSCKSQLFDSYTDDFKKKTAAVDSISNFEISRRLNPCKKRSVRQTGKTENNKQD